jgi:hypothetical protein
MLCYSRWVSVLRRRKQETALRLHESGWHGSLSCLVVSLTLGSTNSPLNDDREWEPASWETRQHRRAVHNADYPPDFGAVETHKQPRIGRFSKESRKKPWSLRTLLCFWRPPCVSIELESRSPLLREYKTHHRYEEGIPG